MTEYELFDLLNGLNQSIAAVSAVMVSQQIAYVVAIYLVGKKLSKLESAMLMIAYTLFLSGPFFALLGLGIRFVHVQNELNSNLGSEPIDSLFQYYAFTTYFTIYIATIFFTFYVRKRS